MTTTEPAEQASKLPERKVHDASTPDDTHLRYIPTPFDADDDTSAS